MKLEAFASERRARLTSSDDALRPVVEAGLNRYLAGEADWFDGIVDEAAQLWLENFQAEAPGAGFAGAMRRFRASLTASLEKTSTPAGGVTPGQVERVTRWASTFTVNAGTVNGAYARGVRFKIWVDMEDGNVREMHKAASGQLAPIGGTFRVGGHKLAYPGDPVGPPDVWIECRCVAMPAARTGETMSVNTFDLGPQPVEEPVENEETEETEDADRHTGALVVLLPAAADPVNAASSEDMAHLTTVRFGDLNEMPVDREELEQAVRLYAEDLTGPVVVPVSQVGTLGDEGAEVAYLEPTDSLIALRDGLLEIEPVRQAYDAAEQFPQWTPHVTLGYPEGVENGPPLAEYTGTEVAFDRVGLWLGGEYLEYPMGGAVETIVADGGVDLEETGEMLEPGLPAEEAVLDDELDDDEEPIEEIPVHGVLAPEGVETGDGRGFREGALSVRPLPVPLRMEIVGSHGGNNTSEVVTVGRIDKAWRDDATKMWRFTGAIVLSKEHAGAAIEAIIDQTGRGVSIDADAMSVDTKGFSEEALVEAEAAGKNPTTWFRETRVAGLTMVPIPAFPEAYIALGPDFEEDMTDDDREAAEAALVACGCAPTAEEAREVFKLADTDTFAPGTKDGPGWITHPIPTSRIRRYWVRGEGAAKIGWGRGGDFNRCRRQLAKYVQRPDWLAGLCANMHKEVLGVWPGQEGGNRGRHSLIASGGVPADIATIVASAAADDVYPAEWFADPGFTEPTPLTIDMKTRRIFGHLARWGSCHIGVSGICQEPPPSHSGYANFLKGVVDTTEGEQVVGTLTYGIGHANPAKRAAAATAHYDQMDAVVAYVNVGEDAHGIWYNGVIPDDVPLQRIKKLRAVGAFSGDWRHVGRYGLDLVAAVSVNTPGFPVPAFDVQDGVQMSLVAAGVVMPGQQAEPAEDDDPNAAFVSLVAQQVLDRIAERERLAERTRAAQDRALALRVRDARERVSKGV